MSEKRCFRQAGGQSGESSQIDKHLSSMEPDELIDELADKWDAMDDKDFDPELIDAYLAALDKMDPIASDFNAEASLADFHEKHALLLRQTAPAPKSSDTLPRVGQHRYLRTARLIAAVVAATLICMIAAQALGYDVFGIIARWTEETFHFTPPGQAETEQVDVDSFDTTAYQSLQEALDAYGITAAIAPNWYPADFEMSGMKTTSAPGEMKFRAIYDAGEKFVAVTIWQYESAEDASSEAFEKSDSTVLKYESGGVTHYLMSNNGQMKAAWTDQNMVCSISGDLSEDELKKMIDSIYER
jgi:anti-sigma factor RsiW